MPRSSSRKPNQQASQDASRQEAQSLEKAVDDFDQAVVFASENGLFMKQGDVQFDDVETHVQQALQSLNTSPSDVIKARSELAKGHDLFNTAVQKAGLGWRVQYAYAVPYFLYLVGTLAVIMVLALFVKLPSTPSLIPVPKRAFMWGMIGSTLQGLWWLWNQVSKRHFRKSWMAWFLSVPFIGSLLGGIMYLAFWAGFIAATKSSLTDSTVPLILAALAGYNWKWAVGVLDNLGTVFNVNKG